MISDLDRDGLAIAVLCALLGTMAWSWPSFSEHEFVGTSAWSVLIWSLGWASWRISLRLTIESDVWGRLLSATLIWTVLASSIVAYLGFFRVFSFVPQALAVALIVLVASRISAERMPESREARIALSWLDTGRAGLLLFSGLALAISALNYVRYFKADSDNMWFHQVVVAEWFRTGSIWPSETIPLIGRAYPGFRQAIHTFLTTPVGTEHLDVVGLAERALFGLAVFVLLGRIGARGIFVVAVALYAATMPVAAPMGNDLWLGILFAMAAYFVSKLQDRRSAVLVGLAVGGLFCTKFSGVILGGVLLATQLVIMLIAAGERVRRRSILMHGVIAILIAALVAWPWYARNLIAFGNPLYPAQISLGSLVLFDGPYDTEFFAPVVLGWNVMPLLEDWGMFPRAFGVFFGVFFLAIGGLAVLLLTRRRPPRYLFWIVLAVLSVVAYLHQPYTYQRPFNVGQMRYFIPSFVTFMGCLGACVAGSPRPARRIVGGVLSIGVVANVAMWTHFWPHLLAGSVLLALLLRAYWSGWQRVATSRVASSARIVSLGALLGLVVVGVAMGRVRSQHQYSSEYGYRDFASSSGWGPICQYVHKTLQGSRIVVTGDVRFFPLYGDRLQNDVMLWAESDEASALRDFAESWSATHIVCFAPIIDRSERSSYDFGESIAVPLMEQFPGEFVVEFESRGSYLIRLHGD